MGRLRNTWVRVHGESNVMASSVDATDVVWVADDACKNVGFGSWLMS